MRYQIRSLIALSTLVLSLACGGGGSPTAPTQVTATPAPAPAPTATPRPPVSVTMEVQIAPNQRGASATGISPGIQIQDRGFQITLVLNSVNGNATVNTECGLTVGSTTRPLESMKLSANLVDGVAYRIEKPATLVVPVQQQPGLLATASCRAIGQGDGGISVDVKKDASFSVGDLPLLLPTCSTNTFNVCVDGIFSVRAEVNSGGEVRPLRVDPRGLTPDSGRFFLPDGVNIGAEYELINECSPFQRYYLHLSAVTTPGDITVIVGDTRTGVQYPFYGSRGSVTREEMSAFIQGCVFR